MRASYTNGQELKASRFLKRDLIFYVFISGIVTVWIAYFVMTSGVLADSESSDDGTGMALTDQQLLMIFLIPTIGEICLIFWRYHLWSSFAKGATEVPGTVIDVRRGPEGAWILVSYTLEGKEVTTNKSIGGLLPRFGKTVRKGQEVSLLVNSRKPGRYLILDLYLAPQA